MSDYLRRKLNCQHQLADVIREYPEAFAGDNFAQQCIAQLLASNTRGDDGYLQVTAGLSAHRTATQRRRSVRAGLEGCVTDVVQAGPVVARETNTVVEFHMPRTSREEHLIETADDIVKRATPMLDRFVAHKLPEKTITGIPAQIDALKQASAECAEAKRMHVAGKAALRDALPSGTEAMDALQRIFFIAKKGDATAIAKWKNARRVGPSRAKAGQGPAEPATQPAGQTPMPKTA